MTVLRYQPYCLPTPSHGVAVVKSTVTHDITHTWDDNITLSFGGINKIIYQHKRRFSYHDEDSYAIGGAYYLMSLDSSYATLEGDYSTSYSATLSEDYEVTENEIVYMDLRNDILITREKKRTVKFNQTSSDRVAGRSIYSGTAVIHSLHWSDLLGERTFTDTALINTTNSTEGYQTEVTTQGDLWLGMIPPAGWYAESTNDYYDFLVENISDGGYMLFYARWLRDMPEQNTVFDVEDRDFMNTTILDVPPPVQTVAISNYAIVASTATGSAAVDRFGNCLYSLLTVEGTGVTKFVGSLTNADLEKLIGAGKISYPIGVV